MLLDKDTTIAGLPVRRVRTLMKAMGERGFTLDALADIGDLNDGGSRSMADVVQALLTAGYLSTSDDSLEVELAATFEGADDGEVHYWRTTAGAQLAHAVFTGISRDRAELIIARLVERAVAINADSRLPVAVVQLQVFGGFLSDRPKLGDVDVAFELESRYSDPAAQAACREAYRRQPRYPRRRGEPFYHKSHRDVTRWLKGGEGRLSLHYADELPALGVSTTHIIVDQTVAPVERSAVVQAVPAPLKQTRRSL